MRVFVLEDDPDRIRLFAEWLDGTDWQCIHTCVRAYEFKPPYDLILLDHDLGGRQFEQHEDCGLTFCGLVGRKFNQSADVIIHSWNPDGAKAMRHALGNMGLDSHVFIQPFGPTLQRMIQKRKDASDLQTSTT